MKFLSLILAGVMLRGHHQPDAEAKRLGGGKPIWAVSPAT
jgi:hypothetical protein